MQSRTRDANRRTGTDTSGPFSSKAIRLSQLSIARQLLVRLCQATNYGSILGLEVRSGEPVLDPPPTVLLDLKLDVDDIVRPATDLSNFLLKDEVLRLMDLLDKIVTFTIESIEVRAGIPRRVLLKTSLRTFVLQTSPAAHAGVCPEPQTDEETRA